jgi:hypothetical protein
MPPRLTQKGAETGTGAILSGIVAMHSIICAKRCGVSLINGELAGNERCYIITRLKNRRRILKSLAALRS